MEVHTEYIWRIVKKEQETPRVTNLYLEAAHKRPPLIAGQYITVRIPNLGPAEGKAYSIASAPYEECVQLSIKQIGTFSTALSQLSVGDCVSTSAPYGFFYPEAEDHMPLVFIVGGIGITPCLSILKDLLKKGDARPLFLHYSNQTETEIAFYDELVALAEDHDNLHLRLYITREVPTSNEFVGSRMSARELLPDIQAANDTLCFICGAMDFTKSLWRELHTAGVPQHQLYTEGFF